MKTKFRSTITEERLTNLALLSTEKRQLSPIDKEDVIDGLAAVDQGRRLRPKYLMS